MKPLQNDSSKAVERTEFNWQRTSLSLLALSVLAIKLSIFNKQPGIMVFAILAFLGCLALSLKVFRFYKSPREHKVFYIFAGVLCVLLMSIVCILLLIV